MTTNPLVSILIPAHNAEKSLRAAINSCLNQGYEPIEICVLDNASTDGTSQIIDGITDPRVKKLSNDKKGIATARNILVAQAKGKYIAWLDADDIAMPNRIQSQVAFMEDYPEVGVLGSWVNVRAHKGLNKVKWPEGNTSLQAWLCFRNPFVQSSLMIRRTLNPVYNEAYDYMEDYEWILNMRNKTEFQILPEFLCSYYAPQFAIADKVISYGQDAKLQQLWEQQWNGQYLSLFNFIRGHHCNSQEVLADIKSIFKNSAVKEEKAIVIYQAIRLAAKFPSGSTVLYAFINLKWWRAAHKIRPRYI
jgi:glycosyltransferase involved in cell wall biosynthesis